MEKRLRDEGKNKFLLVLWHFGAMENKINLNKWHETVCRSVRGVCLSIVYFFQDFQWTTVAMPNILVHAGSQLGWEEV